MIFLSVMPSVNSTAALMIDGKIAACVGEDRLLRRKSIAAYPQAAIDECLEIAGVRAEQIDMAVLPYQDMDLSNPYRWVTDYDAAFSMEDKIREQHEFFRPTLIEGRDVDFYDAIECEKVRQNLPEVHVVELSGDPSGHQIALLSSPLLAVVELTKEDLQRSDTYARRRWLEHEQSKFESIADFLQSLGIRVRIDSLRETNFSRAMQLINKTNQFNATARKYTASELWELQGNEGNLVGVVSYQDKVTEPENIGVFILIDKSGALLIDNFLLSCRILGREVESAVVHWILDYARMVGARELVGEIVETKRNEPVRDFYKKVGFHRGLGNDWRIETTSEIDAPSWIKIEGSQR